MYARRVALFVLRDKKGRVLLQYRSKTDKRSNYWAFFGGEIENKETPEETVKREAKEELEIELKNFKLFKRYEFQQEDGVHEKFVYIAPLKNSIKLLKEQQQEGENLGLFSFEDLKNLKITKYDMIVLKDLFSK